MFYDRVSLSYAGLIHIKISLKGEVVILAYLSGGARLSINRFCAQSNKSNKNQFGTSMSEALGAN